MKLNYSKIIFITLLVNVINSKKDKNCKTQIIKSFGLQSDPNPKVANILCPAIKFNCCSKHDQMKIHKLYNEHSKNTLDSYYESVNHKFTEFVTKFLTRKDDIKLNLIIDYIKTKKDKDKPSDSLIAHLIALKNKYQKHKSGVLLESANPMKKALKSHYKKVKQLRKTFLCNICNWQNHEFINPETMMITYNKSFCDNIIDTSLELWHQKYVELYEYMLVLDEFLYLVANLRLIEDPVDREILHRYRKDVKKCHASRDSDDICFVLCKEYNINKFTYLIDGEVKLIDKMLKQFEIAYKHLSQKKTDRELFLSKRIKNSHKRFRELQTIKPVKTDKIVKDSLDIQFGARNVDEFNDKERLTEKVKLKTLDDEESNYNLYKIQPDPIQLSKFKIEIQDDFGFDPHLDQKDMNLELTLDKLINNLYGNGSHDNLNNVVVDEEVKNLVKDYSVNDITDFVKDSELRYRGVMSEDQKERAVKEIENNPEVEKKEVERRLEGVGRTFLTGFLVFILF